VAVGGRIREILALNLGKLSDPLQQAVDHVVRSAQGTLLKGPACRDVLRSGAVALNIAEGKVMDPDNCSRVWTLYYSTVIHTLIECEGARNPDLPECTTQQRPVDDSWADWLKGNPPELEQFARTVIFN